MNGNDRFLNVNDAHLRVTGGNVHASSFNLDQISITTTSTTSSTIDFLNETKAFNTRSNIEVGTANLFVDTTTSNVGIRTTSPEYALDVHGPANVSVLTANTVTGFDGTLYLGSHLLPTQNQQFDIGSAEKKIRHLYLSNNSLWIGDDSKISVVEGKMKFLKRNKNIVPSGTEALGGNATNALAHAQNSDPSLNNINQMKLEHWLAYTKSLDGGADKDIKDIFTTDTSNYESVTASEAFKEYDDTNIYSLNKLRLGSAAAAEATLDVVGTIKATSDLTVNTNTFHVDATNSRVGIGKTDPGSTLDVAGTITGSGGRFTNTSDGVVRISNTSTPAVARLVTTGGKVYFQSGTAETSDSRADILFTSMFAGTNYLTILGSNGNVGIGVASPGCSLEIKDSTDQYVGIFSRRFWVHAVGDNSGNVNPGPYDDNTGSPWYGLGFDNLAWNNQSYKYSEDIPILSGYSGVALRSGAGNLVLTTEGRVGIGTTTPGEKLEIVGDSVSVTSDPTVDSYGQLSLGSSSNYSGGSKPSRLKIGIDHAAGGYGKGFIQGIVDSTHADLDLLLCPRNGSVGIGTYNPSYPLDISGHVASGPPSGVWGYYVSTSEVTNVGSPYNTYNQNISIRASENMIAQKFQTYSDRRIKKNIIEIDDNEALTKLRNLQPCKYNYIDNVKGGSRDVYGFIAQEVGSILPDAVGTHISCIPNIYELANVSDSNVITFTNFDTSTFESNATVLKVYDTHNKEHLVNITEVVDDHSVRVDEDLSEWTGSVDESGNIVAGNQLFVYGQEVDDFFYLDKNAIWTVATAALQDVDRQLQAEKAKVASLETQLASVLARLDALEGA